jgi:hypothetical protein
MLIITTACRNHAVHTTCIFSFKNQAPVRHPVTPFRSWRSFHTLYWSTACPYDKRKTIKKKKKSKKRKRKKKYYK